MRQTWWLRLVFAALVSLAALSCGGDDGASGNGNNDDSANDGNGDDTGGPNPLIEAIEGAWEITSAVRITTDADGNERRETIERGMGEPSYVGDYDWVQPADPNDPDCKSRTGKALGPPGDACVEWSLGLWSAFILILDGDRVRSDVVMYGATPQGPCGESHTVGRFFDGGRRFEYTMENTVSDAVACRDVEPRRMEVTARWYTAECLSPINEQYGCGVIPGPGYAAQHDED